MAEARAATLKRMDDIIDACKDDGLDEVELRQLQEARGNTPLFQRRAKLYAKGPGSTFRVARASWRWPRQSVVCELLAGAPADLVQSLATWAYKSSCSLLEQSTQEAWQRAFDQYGTRV